MVAPAICDGHVKRSLVRVSSRVTDMNAGVMVADLARGSSLAALVPVNSYFDHHPTSSSSSSSRQSSTSQAMKGRPTQVPWTNNNMNNNQPISQQTQVPWTNNNQPISQQQSTASQPSVTSSSTTTTTRGQTTPIPATTNAVLRSAIPLTSLSGVQRQMSGVGGGVSVTTSSTPRLGFVGIPASMRNHHNSAVRVSQLPVTRPIAAAPGSVQGQRVGVMTQAPRQQQRNIVATHAAGSHVSTNVQVPDEIVDATRNVQQQRGNNINTNNNNAVSVVGPAVGVPVGKRKFEEKPEVFPSCRNETPRPAKLPRTNTHTRTTTQPSLTHTHTRTQPPLTHTHTRTTTQPPLTPCPHNPQLVEENQRLRHVVQRLMQELGRCQQLLVTRSQAVGTAGVTVH
ncbi:hypothetical protein Pmani_018386 [Petrolisthes manimaculis]|uniref:Uncharacterized protein n=1 Tax=Petrolisthes manimaculis TaxID=1843537 RepID=A0AAE1U4K2_9EUCA|nr:hypothetical protein Pmani_018386 [Petrolisthes manimaculis]